MTYKIYGNTYNDTDKVYEANPNDPLSSSEYDDFKGEFAGSGGSYELEIGGERFDDYIEDVDNNTYTVVEGSVFGAAADENITLEVKYDKDDDEVDPDDDDNSQYIDVVKMDMSEFNDDILLQLKSGQIADRLYLSNVYSFTITGGKTYTESDADGAGNGGDQNSNIFGDGTYVISNMGSSTTTATVVYIGSDGAQHEVEITLSGGGATNMEVMVDFVVCFAKGTMIETEEGPKAIEDIRVGEKVLTKDDGFQAISWKASRRFDKAALAASPHLRPIRVRAGALGPNMPEQDLVVSPQHRFLLSDWRCEMLFGSEEVLVPAKSLINDHSIMVDRESNDVEYIHFMCDAHQIVYSNGVETESFHPGDVGVATLNPAALEELYMIFPHLEGDLDRFGPPARQSLKGFEADVLVSEMREFASDMTLAHQDSVKTRRAG